MRLVFAGTPVFAEEALAALQAAGHAIELVLTRPDKPAQRGQKLVSSPVKRWAQDHGIEVFQPRTLKDPQAWERLRAAQPDLMVVAAYGLILPQEVLDLPRWGCLNIHASLLPRWRGAAPIQRAIQAGDPETGITIMQMDAGLDTGDMRLVRTLPIGPEETGGSVHDRLAELGAQAIVQALDELARDALPRQPQPQTGVTYAAKIERADAIIDWIEPAQAIVNRVRAFDPAPGCVTMLERAPEQPLKVWRAAPAPSPDTPVASGTVLAVSADALTVACGPAHAPRAVSLHELQRPGGRRMPVRAFLGGFAIQPGDRLCAPPASLPSSLRPSS
jgi:methionyl-tRNA formyltransferase